MRFSWCFIVDSLCCVQYKLHQVTKSIWNSSSAIPQFWVLNPMLSKEWLPCIACKTDGVCKVIFGGEEKEHSNLWEHVSWLRWMFNVGKGCEKTLTVVCDGPLFKSFLWSFVRLCRICILEVASCQRKWFYSWWSQWLFETSDSHLPSE